MAAEGAQGDGIGLSLGMQCCAMWLGSSYRHLRAGPTCANRPITLNTAALTNRALRMSQPSVPAPQDVAGREHISTVMVIRGAFDISSTPFAFNPTVLRAHM